MINKSIRLRLILWYTIAMAIIVGLGFVGVRVASGVVLENSIRNYLISTVEENVGQIAYVTELEDGVADYFIPYADGYLRVDNRYLDRLSDVYTALYSEDGEMLYGENPLIKGGTEVNFSQSKVWSIKVDGVDYEIYDRKLSLDLPEGKDVWIRGIVPETRSAQQLESITTISVALLGLAIVVAAVVGYFGVTKLMQPLQDIQQTAEHISLGSELTERIDTGGKEDEIGRLGDSFNRMLDRLEKSFEAERQFTSDASHELRTPTSVILAQTEYSLEKKRPAAEYKEALEVVDRQARRMKTLVEDMLDYTRLDQGSQRYPMERTDLSGVVLEMSDSIRPLAEARGEYKCDIEPSIEIEGNELLLSRVVQNLLSNAIRYGKEGGTIKLSLYSEDDKAVLSVADDGIGIPKDEQEKIFARFYRGDSSRHKKGTGLGLSMVKRVAELHDAELLLDSEPGIGSTFTIKFKKV